MTRKDMEILIEKNKNRIVKLEELLAKAAKEIEKARNEAYESRIKEESSKMFAIALMIVTDTTSAEFTREELYDVTTKHMIDYSELKNDDGKVVGVKLELKEEEDEAETVANIEDGGERAREHSEGTTDSSSDTVQTGIDSQSTEKEN